MKQLVATLSLLALVAAPAAAQEVSLGADVVSRYVWRGTDFGDNASVQPYLELASGGFALGAWGSFAIDDGASNELDLYASFSAGPVSVGITDYHFPTGTDVDYFDFDDEDGTHILEPFVSFTAPGDVPVSLLVAYNAFGDPDDSIYLNASVPFMVGDVEMGFGVGASAGESALYGTDGFGIVDVALSGAKAIPVTDAFAIPVFVQYIVNPYEERSFLVFGVSF